MTKIAVLGARGRIGRAVARAFIDAGYEVRAVTRDGKLPDELAGAGIGRPARELRLVV